MDPSTQVARPGPPRGFRSIESIFSCQIRKVRPLVARAEARGRSPFLGLSKTPFMWQWCAGRSRPRDWPESKCLIVTPCAGTCASQGCYLRDLGPCAPKLEFIPPRPTPNRPVHCKHVSPARALALRLSFIFRVQHCPRSRLFGAYLSASQRLGLGELRTRTPNGRFSPLWPSSASIPARPPRRFPAMSHCPALRRALSFRFPVSVV